MSKIIRSFAVVLITFTLACAVQAPRRDSDYPGSSDRNNGKDDAGDNGNDSGKNNNGNNPDNNSGGGNTGGSMQPDAKPTGSAPPIGVKFGLFPKIVYTGVDGTHTYKVPVSTDIKGTLTWTVTPPSLATIVQVPPPADEGAECGPGPGPDGGVGEAPETYAMVTATSAGKGKITVTNGTDSVSADIIITQYTAQQYQIAQTRYTTAAANGQLACITCHGGANGVDHSPSVLAYWDDPDLIGVITTGVYKDGYKLRAPGHMFNLTAPERDAMLSYVRSLPPSGF